MSVSAAPRRATTLAIAFLDLKGFSAVARRLDDVALAAVLDEFYCLADAAAHPSGGTVLKLIGDGALLTWPADHADDALTAMIALRRDVERWAARHALDTSLVVRLHYGDVLAGDFGPTGRAHRDVIGRAAFVAARIEARTLSTTAEFFPRPHARRAAPPQEAHAAGRVYPGARPAAVTGYVSGCGCVRYSASFW
jgi:adenylate cyclase